MFNKHGKLTNAFDSAIACAEYLGVNRSYVYKAIDLGLKVNNNFTLSQDIKERLAKKSTIVCKPDITDYVIMQKYKTNLINSLGEKIKDRNTLELDKSNIINEIVNLNSFLCS